MAKLVKAVFVRDPERHRTVVLHAGEEPEPRLAALVTNPDAWEDGKLPAQDADGQKGSPTEDHEDDTDKAATATKKTAAKKTAATTRSRGRNAAEQGDSGE
ncbi:hypothetical protein [Streptomyces bluensis]|uniref:Uncharacterized protein n=1 Tax=Streptomyces bluensis TaxID=33897 RepID=A0ABW6UUF6_9ACTN